MATPDERSQTQGELAEALEQLSAIKASSLARTEELSPGINFSETVPHFERMLDVFRELKDRDLSSLPTQQLKSVLGSCKSLRGVIEKVRGFSLNQNTPADVCKSIVEEVKNIYDGVVNPLLLPLAFTATQATDYSRIEREAKGYHATMAEEHKKLLQFVEKAKKEAAAALEAVRDQAAEAGVASNAQIFQKSAAQFSSAAGKWMKATIIASSITLLVACGFLWLAFAYHPGSTAEAVQYVVAKIFILSVLMFSVYWCAREYKSLKHNQTLTEHRANALLTFRAFVEGSSDERVKDAVLLHAAQAAFAGRPTGYDSPDSDVGTVNPVVEILGRSIPGRGDN